MKVLALNYFTNYKEITHVMEVIARLQAAGDDCHSIRYMASGAPFDKLQTVQTIHVEVTPDYADYLDVPVNFDYDPMHGLFICSVDDDMKDIVPICTNNPLGAIVKHIDDLICDWCYA